MVAFFMVVCFLVGIPVEPDDIFYVVRVREHIHGLYGGHTVQRCEEGEVAGLRRGVAAHVDDALRGGPFDGLQHLLVYAGPRRVEYHHVGPAVPGGSQRSRQCGRRDEVAAKPERYHH